MEKIKLSPPWITYYKEICELFKKDNDIVPIYNEEKKSITIGVLKYEKAKALKKLIPSKKTFGNVVITINVDYIEPNTSISDTYKAAFENNPAFKYVFDFNTGSNTITYVVFEKEVVQFWNDDMSDPHGVTSTLYENIAQDVFDTDGVIFSTDSDKNPNWKEEYYKHRATPEEVKLWEKYNGKDSFHNGKTLDGQKNPEGYTGHIFCKKEKKAEEYPF